ncbi:MAG TPA: phage head closure protein [Wenzhouxiangella sp.]|nr:phage head closure protein [Wenzhouxiangella sp.]
MQCCQITAGKLRHTITIEREQSVSDGAGGSYLTWATVATPRAYIKPMSGGERLQAMRLEATVTHRIFIRYRDDLLTSDRINFNGRLMQIRALINLEERDRWLEIYADEGVAT